MAGTPSKLLNDTLPAVQQALASRPKELAVWLVTKMPYMSIAELETWVRTAWELTPSMDLRETVAFVPFRRTDAKGTVVPACIIQTDDGPLPRGVEVEERYGLRFVLLDRLLECPSYAEFVKGRLFAFAEGVLKKQFGDNVLQTFQTMQLYTGRGLILRHKMPQPELEDGTPNKDFQIVTGGKVWTISSVDEHGQEVLKYGMDEQGRIVIAPWSPNSVECKTPGMARLSVKQWTKRKDTLYRGCMFTLGLVKLHIYDFTGGWLPWLSNSVLGQHKYLGHTAVEAYGTEFYVDDSVGPKTGAPGSWMTRRGKRKPSSTRILGVTEKSKTDLEQHIDDELCDHFQGNYHKFKRNCNHYSERLTKYLLDQGLPTTICFPWPRHWNCMRAPEVDT